MLKKSSILSLCLCSCFLFTGSLSFAQANKVRNAPTVKRKKPKTPSLPESASGLQTDQTPGAGIDTKPAPKPTSSWFFEWDALYGAGLFNPAPGEKRFSSNINIVTLGYKFNTDYSLAAKGGYNQNFNTNKGDFADTSLMLKKSAIPLGKYLVLKPSAGGMFPTSKASRTNLNFTGGLRLTGILAVSPEVDPNLTLNAYISGGENYYDYATDTKDNLVSRYTLTQMYTVGYQWGDFGLSAYYAHRNGWTYRNTNNEAFEICEEATYKINSNFTFLLGHTNGGSALLANGEDTNIYVVDEENSIVYGGLVITL